MKAVSNDLAFKTKYRIGTVNSINWGRVLAQVIYYFQGYLLATQSSTEKVSFAVPSGNFGNVCAGHIARMMGLPIERLVLATNENDVLDEFFKTGIYRARKSAETLDQIPKSTGDFLRTIHLKYIFKRLHALPLRGDARCLSVLV